MTKFMAIIIASYGFFFGTEYFTQQVLAYLTVKDYVIYSSTILEMFSYFGMCVFGILAYKDIKYAKHFIILCLVIWLYYEFTPLLWPINTPEMQERVFGKVGLLAWKPTINILAIGIVHGLVLIPAALSLYKKDVKE